MPSINMKCLRITISIRISIKALVAFACRPMFENE